MNLVALNFVHKGALSLYYLKEDVNFDLEVLDYRNGYTTKVLKFAKFNARDEEYKRYKYWLYKNE